jgi:hypothetical protein
MGSAVYAKTIDETVTLTTIHFGWDWWVYLSSQCTYYHSGFIWLLTGTV